MALEDLGGLVAIAPALLRDMPIILGIMQIIGYVFVSLFFGSIALKGYRGYASPWVRLGARLGIGFFCLVMGLTIANFIPVESTNPLIVMIQRDTINFMIGGLVSSFLMLGGVYLATHNIFDIDAMRLHVKKLEERLRKAELVKREEDKKKPLEKIGEPYRIAGIVVIILLVAFTLLNFRGFPDVNDNILSALGLEQEDIDTILGQIDEGQLPEGCDSLFTILQQHSEEILNNQLPTTDDLNARNLVTEEGHPVMVMYDLVHEGRDYILVVTRDSNMCHVRDGRLCGCMDVSSFITISQ